MLDNSIIAAQEGHFGVGSMEECREVSLYGDESVFAGGGGGDGVLTLTLVELT